MSWLQFLALAAQVADAGVTCHTLAHGGRELNPLLPNSCAGIVAVKSALVSPMFWLPSASHRNVWATVMLTSGGVAVTVTLIRR